MEPVRSLRSSALRRRPRTAAEFRLRGIECWADIYHLPWVNEQAARAEQIAFRAQVERAARALAVAFGEEPAPLAISDAQFDNALARLVNLRMQQALIRIVLSELAHETWGEDSPLHDVYKTHAGRVDECWLELRRLQYELPREYVPARTTVRRTRSVERSSNRITRRCEGLREGREEPVAGRASIVESRPARKVTLLSERIDPEQPPESPDTSQTNLISPVRRAQARSRAEFRSRPSRPSRRSSPLRVQQFEPRQMPRKRATPHAAGPGGACLRIAA